MTRFVRLRSSPPFPQGAAARPASVELHVARAMARAWSQGIDEERRQAAAWAFIVEVIRGYAETGCQNLDQRLQVAPLGLAVTYPLDSETSGLASALGWAAGKLDPLHACYQISSAYTAMLPAAVRREWGAYYTPPALTERLLNLAEEAGVDWATARVLDPACGGGAFLLPVALRMRAALPALSQDAFVKHLGAHLRGFEIDPFAAWLTQVWLETTFVGGRPVPAIVSVVNSLDHAPGTGETFDLVIGNPPYGRIALTPAQRTRYRRSLFGHANLYGVFTDLALRWSAEDGVIAYVTPTSFLSGEYFKSLRDLIAREAPPVAIDFISARRGVFEDVLQEAALSIYRRGRRRSINAEIHHISVGSGGDLKVVHAGRMTLPAQARDPWLAPREPAHKEIAEGIATMPTRLKDWGYTVSTGPLVWNRYKNRLRSKPTAGCYPLVWAECVTPDSEFRFRAEKRGHQPYFCATAIDDWLKVITPCVLLQRTTAKEQVRRLIAAELPLAFIQRHGAVIVENHLNMVRPIAGKPLVSPAAVAALFNSKAADQAFRCISGSVAVSAFELEALPLPTATQMQGVERLILESASRETIAGAVNRLFKWNSGP